MVAHEPLFKIFLFVCYNMEAKKVLRLKHLFYLLPLPAFSYSNISYHAPVI